MSAFLTYAGSELVTLNLVKTAAAIRRLKPAPLRMDNAIAAVFVNARNFSIMPPEAWTNPPVRRNPHRKGCRAQAGQQTAQDARGGQPYRPTWGAPPSEDQKDEPDALGQYLRKVGQEPGE